MICKSCSKEEKRKAPAKGQDVEMEEKGYVCILTMMITLLQCPRCKDVALESELA